MSGGVTPQFLNMHILSKHEGLVEMIIAPPKKTTFENQWPLHAMPECGDLPHMLAYILQVLATFTLFM
jgi:hypothetical protein